MPKQKQLPRTDEERRAIKEAHEAGEHGRWRLHGFCMRCDDAWVLERTVDARMRDHAAIPDDPWKPRSAPAMLENDWRGEAAANK